MDARRGPRQVDPAGLRSLASPRVDSDDEAVAREFALQQLRTADQQALRFGIMRSSQCNVMLFGWYFTAPNA